MKPVLLNFFLLAFLFSAAATMPARGQETAATPPDGKTGTESAAPTPGAPPMGENDRLPFMESEQNASGGEVGSGGLLLRAVGSMALIVGLIFVAAWGLKKYGFTGIKSAAGTDDPELTVISTVSLGSGRSISTVRFGEKILLVGSTAQSFTLLADSAANGTPAPPAAQSESGPRSVAELLAEEAAHFTPPDDFGAQFERARAALDALGEDGGKAS